MPALTENPHLHQEVRQQMGCDPQPSAAIIDSQSLRTTEAEMGYRGERLKTWIEHRCGWKLEMVKRASKWGRYPVDVEPSPLPAFTVLGRRWVVERALAWVGRYGRMSKDYEYLKESSEAMLHLCDDSLDAATTGTESSTRSGKPPEIGVTALRASFLNSL